MKYLFLSISFLLASCSSMSKNECKNADWWELGYSDLSQEGRNSSYFDIREKACSKYKLSTDKDTYLKGWNEAIPSYCTNETIYKMGTKGTSFLEICPTEKHDELYEYYSKGKKVFEINKIIKEAEKELSNLENNSNNSILTDIEKRMISNKKEKLKAEIRNLKLEKIKYSF